MTITTLFAKLRLLLLAFLAAGSIFAPVAMGVEAAAEPMAEASQPGIVGYYCGGAGLVVNGSGHVVAQQVLVVRNNRARYISFPTSSMVVYSLRPGALYTFFVRPGTNMAFGASSMGGPVSYHQDCSVHR